VLSDASNEVLKRKGIALTSEEDYTRAAAEWAQLFVPQKKYFRSNYSGLGSPVGRRGRERSPEILPWRRKLP
jgi:hypothetical protein